jgi:hypothetical protein
MQGHSRLAIQIFLSASHMCHCNTWLRCAARTYNSQLGSTHLAVSSMFRGMHVSTTTIMSLIKVVFAYCVLTRCPCDVVRRPLLRLHRRPHHEGTNEMAPVEQLQYLHKLNRDVLPSQFCASALIESLANNKHKQLINNQATMPRAVNRVIGLIRRVVNRVVHPRGRRAGRAHRGGRPGVNINAHL